MLTQIADYIDLINKKIGRAVAWLVLTMAIVTFTVATMRYGFKIGWIWLQETYVWMHGTIIMVAMAYTLMVGGHVRVDIIFRSASVRYRALVDILGTLFLLFPSLFVVAKYTIPYVVVSWERFEVSREAGGLPGLYLFKSTMLFFFALLFLQGIAILIRGGQAMVTGKYELDEDKDVSDAPYG